MNYIVYQILELNEVTCSHERAREYYARGYEIAVLSNQQGFWEQLQLWVH
jgi:hypothetical protein